MSVFLSLYKKMPHTKSGFTIIELMVTITIVVLVTGLIMIQYSSFNSSVLLKSQAYLTAFDIREAQTLAVGVRGQGAEFREEYGLYFSMAASDRNWYVLFQDKDALGVQNPVRFQPGEEIGVPYKVDPRFSIINICATNSSSRTCYAADPHVTGEVVDTTVNSLAISFKRPDFDAMFYVPGKSNVLSVEIKFGTPNSTIVRTVTVYQTGQISVN